MTHRLYTEKSKMIKRWYYRYPSSHHKLPGVVHRVKRRSILLMMMMMMMMFTIFRNRLTEMTTDFCTVLQWFYLLKRTKLPTFLIPDNTELCRSLVIERLCKHQQKYFNCDMVVSIAEIKRNVNINTRPMVNEFRTKHIFKIFEN